MYTVSKFDLWMYRITTYVIYPLYIIDKIFQAVFTYDVIVKISALIWGTLAFIIFFGLHKKWKFAFYVHYIPLFILLAGSVMMIVLIPSYGLDNVAALDNTFILYSVICIALLLLSIFLMYKWWDVKPLFYSDDKEVNNSVIIKLKEKLSLLVNYCGQLIFSILCLVSSIAISILPIYATIVDARADRVAWAVIDIVCFPLGFIRGIGFLFGWM